MAKVKNVHKKIVDGFIDISLNNNKSPMNVYLFTKELGIEEKDFYDSFNSLDDIDEEIWNGLFQSTLEKMKADSVYQDYSAREKLLAFYYTFIETAKEIRSYLVFLKEKKNLFSPFSNSLRKLKNGFDDYVKEIIQQAVAEGEVEDRNILTDKYYLAFWAQFIFVLHFWLGDKSKKFEQTDAAIEKAVNLSFDILARNPLDSMVDFGKFIIQSKAGM